MDEAPTAVGAPPNPYVDEEVVYTISLLNGARITGRFAEAHDDRPFWLMNVNNEAGWLDVNPDHIVTVIAAEGRLLTKFLAGGWA